MSGFFRSLLGSRMVVNAAESVIHHVLTAAGVWALGWLASHNADPTKANEFVQYLIAGGTVGTGMVLSMFSKANQDTRVQASVAAGQVLTVKQAKAYVAQGQASQRAADQGQADTTEQAITKADSAAPATKADLLADLEKGS